MQNKEIKKSEFRYRGKDLGLEKLEILALALDDIEDHDIEYLIIDDNNETIDTTDCVRSALDIVLADNEDEDCEDDELPKPWHIKIVWADTNNNISKSRFRKLFGDALLLEFREK